MKLHVTYETLCNLYKNKPQLKLNGQDVELIPCMYLSDNYTALVEDIKGQFSILNLKEFGILN